MIPLTVVGAEGKPLNGACMTVGRHRRRAASATPATSSTTRCRSCARRRRSAASRPSDGVHMGPCEIHKRARPHHRSRRLALRLPRLRRRGAAVDRPHRRPAARPTATQALRNFEKLAAWEKCNDCAFIPVCAGGCTVAAHNELGDMHAPNCHKPSFEAGLDHARARSRGPRDGRRVEQFAVRSSVVRSSKRQLGKQGENR